MTAGLYGLMAQRHLAPGSFSWDAAAGCLADCLGPGPAGVSQADDRLARPDEDNRGPR